MYRVSYLTRRIGSLRIVQTEVKYTNHNQLFRALSHSTVLRMPPKKSNGAKRKASTPLDGDGATNNITNGSNKKIKTEEITDPLRQPHERAAETEEHGIVLRKYYPHEMHNRRALAYNNDEIPRPIEVLGQALEDTSEARKGVGKGESVVHWFKNDLRTMDNRALSLAAEKAKELGVPLIAIYIVSPQDFEAHLTAPVRVDFILRTLEVLKDDLAKLDIPLYVETVEKRRNVQGRITELLEEWGTKHMYTNMEYEVDELRREARMVSDLADKGISFEVLHDTCVVEPGKLVSGSGKQYSVYSPWYRSWMVHVQSNLELLDLFDAPEKNPKAARERFKSLFQSEIPDAPSNKTLTAEEKKRFRALWPAGEREAHVRLDKFVTERIKTYKDERNFPAINMTSSLSVHFASGTLSARTAVRTARDKNSSKRLDAGNQGNQTWISEVAWRDFYKHVLAHWPYVW